MSNLERMQKIESYGNAYQVLVDALKQFPEEMWQYRPFPNQWSIHELIVHIADSEANSYVRCRRLIAEPGESVMAYNEGQWARSLNYQEQSPEDSLELFKRLRMKTYMLIKSLPETVWSNTVYHPEIGTMTLDDWLDIYERHIPEHVEQMRSNYQAWVQERRI